MYVSHDVTFSSKGYCSNVYSFSTCISFIFLFIIFFFLKSENGYNKVAFD